MKKIKSFIFIFLSFAFLQTSLASQKQPSFSKVLWRKIRTFCKNASPACYYKQRQRALEQLGLVSGDPEKKAMSQKDLVEDFLAPEHVQNYLKEVWNEQHKISPDSFWGKILGKINPNHNYPKVIQVGLIEAAMRNGQLTKKVAALHTPGIIIIKVEKETPGNELSIDLKEDISHESRHGRQISSYLRYLYQIFLECFGDEYERFYFAEYDAKSFEMKKRGQELAKQGKRTVNLTLAPIQRLEDHPYTYAHHDMLCRDPEGIEVLIRLEKFSVKFEKKGYQIYPEARDYDGDQTFEVTRESLKDPSRQTWKTRYAEFLRLSKPDIEEDFEPPLW